MTPETEKGMILAVKKDNLFMKVEPDVKLDFSNVCIKPRISELESRQQVDLLKQIKTISSNELRFVPVMNANMASSGTFEVARELLSRGCLATVHKHYKMEEWKNFLMNNSVFICNMFFPMGIEVSACEELVELNKKLPTEKRINNILLDVANGHSTKFHDTISRVREKFPDAVIAAGNVVTGEATIRLIESGADIVKVGIGNGCLAAGTRVLMENGMYKNIEDIKVGDRVISKYGRPVNVVAVKYSGIKEVYEYRSGLFHSPTLVTKCHKHWSMVKDGSEEGSWDKIESTLEHKNLTFPRKLYLNMPSTFSNTFSGMTLTPSYNTGYMIGIILSDPNISPTSDTLQFFEESGDRFLPESWWCDDPDYLTGLLRALERKHSVLSTKLKETLFIIKRILEIPIDTVGNYIPVEFVDKPRKTNVEVPTYDIEVDCDTHSFIANNAIVHNSMCTTRLKAGVGVPQLSAVIECSYAADSIGGHIISDGGCVVVADFAKAIGAGADIVMSGSFFAASDESGGDVIIIDGKKYMLNFGMSSRTAQEKFNDGVKSYRTSEGRTARVPYRGPINAVLDDIFGGLRSACTYVGAKNISELPGKTTFVRVFDTHNRSFEHLTIGD